jgi:hypothetical protein
MQKMTRLAAIKKFASRPMDPLLGGVEMRWRRVNFDQKRFEDVSFV